MDLDWEILYTRINRRVEQMMETGLLEEVKQVQHLKEYTAMKTLGYRELFRVLDEELSINEGVDLIKRNTRKFARKQLTWFRKEKRYQWFSPGNCKEIVDWIETESGYL